MGARQNKVCVKIYSSAVSACIRIQTIGFHTDMRRPVPDRSTRQVALDRERAWFMVAKARNFAIHDEGRTAEGSDTGHDPSRMITGNSTHEAAREEPGALVSALNGDEPDDPLALCRIVVADVPADEIEDVARKPSRASPPRQAHACQRSAAMRDPFNVIYSISNDMINMIACNPTDLYRETLHSRSQ